MEEVNLQTIVEKVLSSNVLLNNPHNVYTEYVKVGEILYTVEVNLPYKEVRIAQRWAASPESRNKNEFYRIKCEGSWLRLISTWDKEKDMEMVCGLSLHLRDRLMHIVKEATKSILANKECWTGSIHMSFKTKDFEGEELLQAFAESISIRFSNDFGEMEYAVANLHYKNNIVMSTGFLA